jgi:hypothetical protein
LIFHSSFSFSFIAIGIVLSASLVSVLHALFAKDFSIDFEVVIIVDAMLALFAYRKPCFSPCQFLVDTIKIV